MNKKLFNKLREQADLEALDIYEAHPNFPMECYPSGFYTDTRDKIFAELIIKECSKLNDRFIGHRIGEIDLDVIYKDHFKIKKNNG